MTQGKCFKAKILYKGRCMVLALNKRRRRVSLEESYQSLLVDDGVRAYMV
jgi:hypothetical protein